jgi:head-tail adaptor
MISGGVLSHVATRLAASDAQDALGMRTDVWTESGTFRCDLRNDSTTEQQYADGVVVVRSCEVRARWQAVQKVGLTELDRLSLRGRTMRVQSIRNLDEADRVAVILCEEIN